MGAAVAGWLAGDEAKTAELQNKMQIARERNDTAMQAEIWKEAIRAVTDPLSEDTRPMDEKLNEVLPQLLKMYEGQKQQGQQGQPGGEQVAGDLNGDGEVSPNETRVYDAEQVMKDVKEGKPVPDAARVEAEAVLKQHKERVAQRAGGS